ncbi:hypothetical protein ACJ3XI_01320 [Litorimonas sp. RW-G-Af-16]|uniref:hypothetical protein n=1 Tax=Litorimonas sp. RW-G-Af-16 TaxID=3241168 RepID=UPI00390C5A08
MTEITTPKPTTMFWILGGLFLLWNVFGCYMYYLDMTLSDAAYAESYGEAMAALRDQYPTWSVAAYAIAVWGGLAAAILYLLRKAWCVPVFILSLIAAVLSFAWGLTNAEMREAAGTMGWAMPLIVVTAGIFEIWWSRKMKGHGWLN